MECGCYHLPSTISSIDLQLHTDASDQGFAGVCHNCWIQSRWHHSWDGTHINTSVGATARTWDSSWANKQIVIGPCFT